MKLLFLFTFSLSVSLYNYAQDLNIVLDNQPSKFVEWNPHKTFIIDSSTFLTTGYAPTDKFRNLLCITNRIPENFDNTKALIRCTSKVDMKHGTALSILSPLRLNNTNYAFLTKRKEDSTVVYLEKLDSQHNLTGLTINLHTEKFNLINEHIDYVLKGNYLYLFSSEFGSGNIQVFFKVFNATTLEFLFEKKMEMPLHWENNSNDFLTTHFTENGEIYFYFRSVENGISKLTFNKISNNKVEEQFYQLEKSKKDKINPIGFIELNSKVFFYFILKYDDMNVQDKIMGLEVGMDKSEIVKKTNQNFPSAMYEGDRINKGAEIQSWLDTRLINSIDGNIVVVSQRITKMGAESLTTNESNFFVFQINSNGSLGWFTEVPHFYSTYRKEGTPKTSSYFLCTHDNEVQIITNSSKYAYSEQGEYITTNTKISFNYKDNYQNAISEIITISPLDGKYYRKKMDYFEPGYIVLPNSMKKLKENQYIINISNIDNEYYGVFNFK